LSYQSNKKKIGILGGTFDPVHQVHLMVGELARDALQLDEIWFLPAYIPPHKQNRAISEPQHRINMLEAAIVENPNFKVSSMEMERGVEGRPSYTYNTMIEFKKAYPFHEFYFIIGGDMVEYLPKWHKINELTSMIHFVALARPGYTLATPYPVIVVEMPQLDLSSSIIRERVASGQTIRYLVPEGVRLYIKENHLYES
jgi:nicotinate-nucleotide adenylyltransferase